MQFVHAREVLRIDAAVRVGYERIGLSQLVVGRDGESRDDMIRVYIFFKCERCILRALSIYQRKGDVMGHGKESLFFLASIFIKIITYFIGLNRIVGIKDDCNFERDRLIF